MVRDFENKGHNIVGLNGLYGLVNPKGSSTLKVTNNFNILVESSDEDSHLIDSSEFCFSPSHGKNQTPTHEKPPNTTSLDPNLLNFGTQIGTLMGYPNSRDVMNEFEPKLHNVYPNVDIENMNYHLGQTIVPYDNESIDSNMDMEESHHLEPIGR